MRQSNRTDTRQFDRTDTRQSHRTDQRQSARTTDVSAIAPYRDATTSTAFAE